MLFKNLYFENGLIVCLMSSNLVRQRLILNQILDRTLTNKCTANFNDNPTHL